MRAFLEHKRDEVFGAPVIDMVDNLPRAVLASTAEALVSIQSLRHRVTMATETVSGPIDVVLISKADGLVWVKRKQS